jgi:hypothetical protein
MDFNIGLSCADPELCKNIAIGMGLVAIALLIGFIRAFWVAWKEMNGKK